MNKKLLNEKTIGGKIAKQLKKFDFGIH